MKSRIALQCVRFVLWTIAVVLVLAALTVAIARTAWFRGKVERRIEWMVESATGAKATLAGMTFNPLLLRMTFRRVALRGTEAAANPPLLSAEGVFIELGPMALLRGHVHVRSFSWASAAIHVETDASGATNLPLPGKAGQTTPSPVMNWSVSALNLAHTRIYWNDRRLPLAIRADGVAVLVRESRRRELTGDISSTGTIARTPLGELPPIRFTARFKTAGAKVKISVLSAEAGGLHGAGEISITRKDSPTANFTFSLLGGVAPWARALHLDFLRGGSTLVETRGSYDSSGLSASGRLTTAGLEIQSPLFEPGPVNFESRFAASGKTMELRSFRLAALGATAEGRAQISFGQGVPKFRVESTLSSGSLARLLAAVPAAGPVAETLHPVASLSGSARASWEGNLRQLEAELDLNAAPPKHPAGGTLPLGGTAQARVTNDHGYEIAIKQLRLRSPASTLTAQGTLGAAASTLKIQAKTRDLAEWRPLADAIIQLQQPAPVSVNSPGSFTGTISGALDHLQIRGELKGGAFELAGERWDRFETAIGASSKFATLTGLRLERVNTSVQLDLAAGLSHWTFTPQSTLDISLLLNQTPVEGLEAAAGLPPRLTGRASGQVHLTGTAAGLDGSGEITIEPLSADGEKFDRAEAQLKISESVWSLENIRIEQGAGRATGRAEFDPAKRKFSAELSGSEFELARIFQGAIPNSAARSKTPKLGGIVSFKLTAGGSSPDWTLASEWQFQKLAVGKVSVGDLTARADVKGGVAHFEGNVSGPAGAVGFTGNADIRNLSSPTLGGRFQNLDVAPWLTLLRGAGASARARATGTFAFSGPVMSPARIIGQAKIQNLKVSLSGAEWSNTDPIELHYADGSLRFNPFRMRGPATDFQVSGSVGLAAAEKLDLEVNGRANPEALTLLDPSVHAAGQSSLQLHVGGTLSKPALDGKLTVTGLTLGYGELPARLVDLHGDILLRGDRAILENLRGRSGGGTVTASGFVAIGREPRYDLRASFSEVELREFPDITPLVDGELRLSGAGAQARLDGAIRLRDVLVSASFNPINWLGSASASPGLSLGGSASSLASHIGLNVSVSTPAPVRFYTPETQAMLTANARLEGTLASPRVLGALNLLSGQTVFRGNRYVLTRGEISLTSPYRLEPLVDVEATTRVDKYRLTLEISGPLDRLKLSYRSDPPLPAQQIATLLAFGYSRQGQAMTQTGAHAFSSVGTSALLSEALSNELSARIERIFGVSRIEVNPASDIPGAVMGTQLTIEQQLSPDLTLTYSTNTSSSQYRVIRFDWALSERVSLIGIRDRNGVFGIELKFRRRFR